MQKIASALVAAQRDFSPALKTSSNPHFKSKYADLAACVEAVIDALHANGIALLQLTHDHPEGVVVETQFVHESGETISGGRLFFPAAKFDPQGFGSALTYARRYSLMAAAGIAPEDDDANKANDTHNDAGAVFAAKHMRGLEKAAKKGTDALLSAFKALPAIEGKAECWVAHRDRLKDIAAAVDAMEVAE